MSETEKLARRVNSLLDAIGCVLGIIFLLLFLAFSFALIGTVCG